MMFGKPVVGCAVGGMCEIVEPGANGFLAIPGDVASLADCLERLIESAELRRDFGQRSRALYEQKYALPIVVENTVRYYREVSERYKAAPPAVPAMGERLAEVIAEAGGVPPALAAGAAARLLDPACFPLDYFVQVRKLWEQPAEEFVRGLYLLLLKREADAEGLEHYLSDLSAGTARGEVVRALALSDEARAAGVPTGWLAETGVGPDCGGLLRRAYRRGRRVLGKVARRLGLRRGAVGGGVSMSLEPERKVPPGRIRRLCSLLSPKKGVRYLKRLVLLPWNFQKLYDQQLARQLEDARRDLATLVEQQTSGLVAQLEQLTETLTKDMRQLRYRFAEFYGALVEEMRRHGAALDQLTDPADEPEDQLPRERGRAA
jgi:hypothetical protein